MPESRTSLLVHRNNVPIELGAWLIRLKLPGVAPVFCVER